MSDPLPTGSFATWTVTALKDSLISTLKSDNAPGDANLRLYFYAVTRQGWSEIRQGVLDWTKFDNAREVSAYVGTDHAITDPAGLEDMCNDGVAVRLMKNYRGVFHPKVVWLKRSKESRVWTGSNNMTRDGLINNIEFAVAIRCVDIPQDLQRWADEVHNGSVELTNNNLRSYRLQRDEFEQERMKRDATTFTWRERDDSSSQDHSLVQQGDLVVEIMARETGSGGKQIQLPVDAARSFFGLTATKVITLTESGHPESSRQLTMTLFQNHTARLAINELEYRDRPCIIVFRRIGPDDYEFEIVRESIVPRQYRQLLNKRCNRQEHKGSRRWGIV